MLMSLGSLFVVGGIAVGLYFLRKWVRGPIFTEDVTANGKVVLVTGANTGLGRETVRELNRRGAKDELTPAMVYMLCRSEARTKDAIQAMVESGCDASRLHFVQCDLASFSSVRRCAETMQKAENHIDILINNAGIMNYPTFELTKDGHELTWQSNRLGHFLLTDLLLPQLKASGNARIINVSSAVHELIRIARLSFHQSDSAPLRGADFDWIHLKIGGNKESMDPSVGFLYQVAYMRTVFSSTHSFNPACSIISIEHGLSLESKGRIKFVFVKRP